MLLLELPSPAVALAFSPDSHTLAVLTNSGDLLAFDPAGVAAPGRTIGAMGNALTYGPDGTLYAGGSDAVYRLSPEDPPIPLPGIGGRDGTYPLGLACVSERILAVGFGHRARPAPGRFILYDLARQAVRRPVGTEPDGVRGVVSHPATKTAIWSNAGRRVTTWDITRADSVPWNLPHVASAIAVSPDGLTLAASQEWGAVLIDRTKKVAPRPLKGHKGVVTSLGFSSDGTRLWTGSWDGTVRQWDAATGAEMASLAPGVGRVLALAVAPDGARVAAAGDAGTVAVWDAE